MPRAPEDVNPEYAVFECVRRHAPAGSGESAGPDDGGTGGCGFRTRENAYEEGLWRCVKQRRQWLYSMSGADIRYFLLQKRNRRNVTTVVRLVAPDQRFLGRLSDLVFRHGAAYDRGRTCAAPPRRARNRSMSELGPLLTTVDARLA